MNTDLFNNPLPDPKLPKPCNNPNVPADQLAPAHPDDAYDAVGLRDEASNRAVCCAVHYVRRLRWKYDLR